MPNFNDTDLQDCLSAQPKSKTLPASQATQELASELLALVDDDCNQAMGIIRELMYYSPNKPIEWYCEQAVANLNQRRYGTAK